MVITVLLCTIVLRVGIFAYTARIPSQRQHHQYKQNQHHQQQQQQHQQQQQQHERCIALKYNQTIIHNDCVHRTIENHICIGVCQSSFLPGRQSDVILCNQCYGYEMKTVRVRLKCPRRRKADKMKRMTFIKSCKCQECSVLSRFMPPVSNSDG